VRSSLRFCALLAIVSFAIVACSSSNTPPPTATPDLAIIGDLGSTGARSTAIPSNPDIEWQQPQAPITAQTITQIRHIGTILPPSPSSTAFFQTFNRDGSQLILLNNDYLLGYDLNSGDLNFRNARQNITFIYVAPEHPELYGVTSTGDVMVMEAQTGRFISEFQAHPRFADVADYATDRGAIALGGIDGTITVWDGHTQETITRINAHIGRVTHIRISQDGKFLLSSGEDFRTIIWDVETGGPIHTIENGNTVTHIALSPDALTVASSVKDYITIWQMDDDSQDKFRYTLNLEDIGLGTVKFSPDNAYLVTGGLESEMALWSAESGDLQAILPDIYSARTSSSFNPNNDLLAVSTITQQAHLFDLTSITDQTIQSGLLNGLDRILSVSFTPDGTRLLLFETSGNIEVWGIP
jgi:WD40 repeat protein